MCYNIFLNQRENNMTEFRFYDNGKLVDTIEGENKLECLRIVLSKDITSDEVDKELEYWNMDNDLWTSVVDEHQNYSFS